MLDIVNAPTTPWPKMNQAAYQHLSKHIDSSTSNIRSKYNTVEASPVSWKVSLTTATRTE